MLRRLFKPFAVPAPKSVSTKSTLVGLLAFVMGASGVQALAQARITEAISDANRISMPGSVPPQAQPRYDQGALPDSTPTPHMLIVLQRSPAQQAALEQMIEGQHESSSPLYHQWLTPEQFSTQFGPADADLEAVRTWLQSQGFTINKTSKGKQVIDFSGTAGLVKSAFHTEMHTYLRNGVVFHSNNGNPEVPVALAPVVSGIVSLNDIKPRANVKVLGSAKLDMTTHKALPSWNVTAPCYSDAGQLVTCKYYVPTPGDMAVQYNVASAHKSGVTGKGVTIGIVDGSNIDLGVVRNYRKLFGLNPDNLPGIVLDGNDPAQSGDSVEAYLDVEAAGALAPDATIDLYVSGDTMTTSGLANAIVRAVDDDVADILSVSYGECEQQLGPSGNRFFYQIWQQAAAQGQSVFVASGDSGSAGCDDDNQESQASDGLAVNGFGSTPYNTAVGATDFYYSKFAAGPTNAGLIAQLEAAWGGSTTTIYPATSLVAPLEEQPWNDSFGADILSTEEGETIVAGGGGVSTCVQGADGSCTGGYPKPSWQTGPGVPKDGARDLPDVALFGADGANFSFWPICQSAYDCLASTTTPGYSIEVTGVGGTSASTPAMAGIVALVDQAQHGRQGNINSRLYALAAQYPSTFNDVTLGSIKVPCVEGSPSCSLDTQKNGFYSLDHYDAGKGYDRASGLGSINGGKLLANWNKVVTNSAATWTAFNLAETKFKHGTPVTATAIVSSASGEPSGLVAVEASLPGQTGQGVITVTSGEGSSVINSLPGGAYTIDGVYNSGEANFRPSTSRPVFVTVLPEESSVTLAGTLLDTNFNQSPLTNGETVEYGSTYYLDATVAGKSGNGTATGSITYLDGATPVGTANLAESTVAEIVTGQLAPGKHKITAKYFGDPSFDASASGSIALNVVKGTPDIFYKGNEGGYTPLVFAGTVYSAPVFVTSGLYTAVPTGTVTIAIGNLPPQTVKLTPAFPAVAAGSATAYFKAPAVGNYPISVSYSGDANYTSTPLTYQDTLTVSPRTQPASTTTFTTSTTSVGPDSTVLLSSTVTGSIANTIPTGYVSFAFSFGIGYVVNLDANGKASLPVVGEEFPTGLTVMTAEYSGDKNYSGSGSKPITIYANEGDYTITASHPDLVLTAGSTVQDEISLQSVLANVSNLGLSGKLSLSCAASAPGMECEVNPASVMLAADGKPSHAEVVIRTSKPEIQPGLHHVTISGDILGVRHSLVLGVRVSKE